MKIRRLFLVIGLIFILFLSGTIIVARSNYVLPILMYHSVRPNPQGNKLIVSPENFEAQMSFLKIHKFRVIGLEELADLFDKGRPFPRRVVAITLDDGYEDNYTYAYPILKKYNFPAVIFIPSNFVGKNGYLNKEQLRELSLNKIYIGSHSITHPWLTEVKEEDLAREIYDSKKMLEDILGKQVDFFCYPFGGFDERVKTIVKTAGYRAAFATSPGSAFSDRDLFALKRIRISGNNNLLAFWIKTSGYYIWLKQYRGNKFKR